MTVSAQQLHEQLATAVVELDEDLTKQLAQQAIDLGFDAWEAVEFGLVAGMDRAGKLFDEEEYFIPELLLASDAMYAGLAILRPHIPQQNTDAEKVRVVIGVIEGDTHDIGKNLVRIMLDVGGFEVIDLGRDVPPRTFVDRAKETGARIIAIASLMTTTMDGMAEVVRILEAEKIRDRFKVIVGGAPISQGFAKKIGADGYASRAPAAVQLAKRLVSEPQAA
ncbi:MAG: corrinoid protein [Chthoniobacteraceae bacterium]|nr:corrinoid protein [Chthoniobacteraceae bacterium]